MSGVLKLNMTMLKIPAHDFAMGQADDDQDPLASDPLEPFHTFWMSDREVSVGQFMAVLKDARKESNTANPQLPMRSISWYDAVEFCRELSRQDGLKEPFFYRLADITRNDDGFITKADVTEGVGNGYRLPTEREWEYACRAMSTTYYSYGSDASWLGEFAVYQQIEVQAGGTKMPNGWGLFDMHGNVDERCGDKSQGNSRVLRGGSFSDSPLILRSAFRHWVAPGYRDHDLGFRVSRT